MLLKDRLSDSSSNSKTTVGDLSSIIVNPNLEIYVMLLEDRLSDSCSNSKTIIGKWLLDRCVVVVTLKGNVSKNRTAKQNISTKPNNENP